MSAFPPDRQDPARHGDETAETALAAASVEVRPPWAAGFYPAPIHPEGPPAGGPAPT